MAMTKSERLRLLLEWGYFPDELPPPFTSSDLAKFRRSLKQAWAGLGGAHKRADFEIFSAPRIGRARRNLAITNPICQFFLSDIISENWVKIKSHINQKTLSVDDVDIVDHHRRAVPTPDFENIRQQTLRLSADHNSILFSDISRFYGTIYTHAIAWCLHGKSWCKAHQYTALPTSLGGRLDDAVRKCQDGQSIGIPIGPDTSRILAELIASSIDSMFSTSSGIHGPKIFRNVDDFVIGLDHFDQPDKLISDLSRSCREYELELNPTKTRIVYPNQHIDTIWPSEIREFNFLSILPNKKQGYIIDHFFAKCFDLSERFSDSNVLDFAVKRTKGLRISNINWDIYESWLVKSVRSNVTTLPAVVEILVNYNADGYSLNKSRIAKLSEDIIQIHAPPGHHAEVSWALFLSKALRLQLGKPVADAVAPLESSVCALLALDLDRRGLWKTKLDKSIWQQSMSLAGLSSRMWLLSYEAHIKGWLNSPTPSHISAHKFFIELEKKNISFYNENTNVRHIRRRRERPTPGPATPFSPITGVTYSFSR
jgi:hypothetical protein